jgi:hypothetical protein
VILGQEVRLKRMVGYGNFDGLDNCDVVDFDL